MTRILAGVVLLAFTLAPANPVYAGEVRIDDTGKQGALALSASKVTVNQALKRLGKHAGFIVEMRGAPSSSRFSAEFSGSVDRILARLLRNRNHLVIRKPNAGIAKVILLDSRHGTAGRRASTARKSARRKITPAGKARMALAGASELDFKRKLLQREQDAWLKEN